MEDDKLWYKDAIIYEVHVRAFFDSDGDGIGDFRGLAEKLDYLADLGINTIWLLPYYPSPLKDDGYDIADYENVNSSYGDLSDFKLFLKEAHRRGIRVINELVLNHTSAEHPWFKKARRAPANSRERNFYVWNDTSEKYRDARIIFKDFEGSNWSWDPVAKAYFWHRFYSHQPDLNFDNPDVIKTMLGIVDYWLSMGVDGMRLDAVPYLFEREGTNCENLPETHQFLKKLRAHIDKKYKDRMLLAEANQWPEDAVTYFGKGDEANMAFHFPIMPRLFMSIHMEDRFPIIDILQQTPAIPESCQWAIFLRNHDELTLEMVTDEERDYMYRVYANDRQARINLGIRRRLAPLLGNNRRKIELMNGLLLSLPGTPVIYYGDELGMGDNIYLGDRNGVRTPMQWSGDKNAGFSRANPQQLFLPVIIDPEYHFETVNVDNQQSNVHSLLWWMKRIITLRKRYKAFSRGSIEFLAPENRKVITFIRQFQDERILVVANLSRFVQCVELDLSKYKEMIPVEMFGRVEFPPIGELPYFVTLGPHGFYWFTLETVASKDKREVVIQEAKREIATISVRDKWESVIKGEAKAKLESVLPDFIRERRWFGGKARKIKRIHLAQSLTIPSDSGDVYINLLNVEYMEGESEKYILPISFARGEKAVEIQRDFSNSVIAKLHIRQKAEEVEGVIYDAYFNKNFLTALLDGIRRDRNFKTGTYQIETVPTRAFKQIWNSPSSPLEPSLMKAEQSNTSVIFGDKFILKLFRRFQEGLNPDLEICRYLTENKKFSNIPAVAGSVELHKGKGEPSTLAILQSFVPNQGDAWAYTLDALGHYYEKILERKSELTEKPVINKTPLELSKEEVDPLAADLINPYLETARLLGNRTAELHMALSEDSDDPAFDPEPFTPFYQRSLYQSMRNLSGQVFHLLSRHSKFLPESIQQVAKEVLSHEPELMNRFKLILDNKITALRIRHHGDFHLGQVLYTGKDFIFIDFEGEPARSLQERKIKRSPLRDVAGMLRSFHYAAYTSLYVRSLEGSIRVEDIPALEPWAYFWYVWAASAFLRAYLETSRKGSFLPKTEEELAVLLDVYTLEKAVYEVKYELNNRPDWVNVPLKGIIQLLKAKDS